MTETGLLDKESPVPLYQQISALLLRQIRDSGQPHVRVPPERELARDLGVSRMTVRAAVEGLVRDGILYTVSGKGTFVCPPRLLQSLQSLTSFTEDMRSRHMKPSAVVLENQTVRSPQDVAQQLGLVESAEVVRIARLRLADGEPMCIEVAHLSASRYSFLVAMDMTNRSLYETLRGHGVLLSHADQSVEARTATPNEAALLGVPAGSVVLVTRRTTYCDSGSPVEYVVSTYRADRYTLQVRLRVSQG